MSNIPTTKEDQLTWIQEHIDLWGTTPTAIGLSAGAITEMDALRASAGSAYEAARAARIAAVNATIAQDQAFTQMLASVRNAVRTVKAFIEASGDETLWGTAGLKPPAPPGTAPAPTAAKDLIGTLDSEGNLILRWKTSQPKGVAGVVYIVRRSLDGGPFTLVDTVGEKMFTDGGIPLGTQTVAYTIQCKRGAQVSPLSASLTLRFGRAEGGGGGGVFIAGVSHEAAPKLAA